MTAQNGSGNKYEGVAYRGKGLRETGYPKEKTALLVIDPVNDFLSEGGAAWDLTKNTVKLHNVVGNLKKAIEGARQRGIPVIFGPMAYTEEDYADKELQRLSGINRIMFERKMFLAGSWGADFHPDLRPEKDDLVLLPHKGTDVFQTDLPDHLENLGISHLVIAGMTANLCCESTGRHAAEAGYDVTYLYDAIGSESVPSYEAAVNLNYPLIGNAVLKVDDFFSVIDSGIEKIIAKSGDKVFGSDHMKIGEVKEVLDSNNEREACLLVEKGIFNTDLFVPLDAVVKRSKEEIYINVPKLVVGKMPWGAPPTKETQTEKEGQNSAFIEKLYRSRSPSIQERGIQP